MIQGMILYADVGGTHVRAWTMGKGKVSELVIGLRGVWTASEKSFWKRKLRRIAPAITVLSDIELAHHLAFGKGTGIVLNAGTGSIAFGRNARGKTARAGGLGPLVGDEGSAFWLGREYLKRRYQMTPEVNGVRSYVTGPKPAAQIAALAKKVLKIAERKPQSFERAIVRKAFVHLHDLVKETRTKLRLPLSAPVALTGGLFENRFFNKQWRRFLSRA